MRYDQWHALSCALVGLGLIAYTMTWRGDEQDRERWRFRQAVLNVAFWSGWLIADVTKHQWWWAGADAFLLVVALWTFDQWRRRRRRSLRTWTGYKIEAIRDRLARGTDPGAAAPLARASFRTAHSARATASLGSL